MYSGKTKQNTLPQQKRKIWELKHYWDHYRIVPYVTPGNLGGNLNYLNGLATNL